MKTRVTILCLTLLAAAAVISFASRPEIVPIRQTLSGLSMQIGNWNGRQDADLDAQVLNVLGVDDYINRVYYNRENFPASLYIGYYQSQRAGDTMHSPLNCLPGAGWNPVQKDFISIPVDGGSAIKINRIVIQKGVEKQVVLYWYQSHGRVVASEYWGKIYTVLDAVRTNRTDAALVRVVCPVSDSDITAEKYAADFVQSLFPHLNQFLPE